MDKNAPVFIASCDSYDKERIKEIMKESFSALGFTEELVKDKKVMIKPNFVLAKKPEFAATTHPAFIEAAAELVHEMGAASVVLAESPGGQYNASALQHTYKVCEAAPLESDILRLNNDFSYEDVHISGEKLKNFHVIKPFAEADVIIDLCKIKSHSLTVFTCSTKNLFGLIPGFEKFEMHSNFPKIEDFSEMLVDLSSYVMENKTFIAVCDGILSMEGNGPSHGTPIKTGVILASASTYALDVMAEHIAGLDGETLHLDCAARRGLVSRSFKDINIIGLKAYPTYEFKHPETNAGNAILRNLPNLMGGKFAGFFETKPLITSKCIGCGKCAESCPKHTITIEKRGKKKKAVIHRENCIRCYCCQELCPMGAVGVKQNPLIKLIH